MNIELQWIKTKVYFDNKLIGRIFISIKKRRVCMTSHIILLNVSNKKILTTDSTNMHESQNHNSQKKKKRVHTV